MGNLKQTELQRTEERKAENRSEKDRTRRITKKITRGKEMVVRNRRPRETAPGHSQKIEAKCCRKLRLEKVVTNKHLRLAVEN